MLQIGFFIFWFITLLPWQWITHIGKWLGRISMSFAPNRVRITAINLSICFPELPVTTRNRLVKQHFEAMGIGFLDMGLAWWATPARLQSLLTVSGTEHAIAAYQHGHGVIFITAHFTALEMGGRFLSSLLPLSPVYRQHRNSQLEQLVAANRMRHVRSVIPRDNVRLLLRTLHEGSCVWFAPDQNFSQKGYVFSPFFNILAATNTATSRFAQLSGAKVVPFVVFRRVNLPGYNIIIKPALENFPSADTQQDTDKINAIFEEWIRQEPSQYLWSHQRFKDRPPGEQNFY